MSEQDKKAETGKEPVTPAKTEKKAKADKKKAGFFQKIARWFKDLKGELKKVTWPSAKDTMKNVLIVIVCVLIVGVLIWGFDWVVKLVVEALLNLFR